MKFKSCNLAGHGLDKFGSRRKEDSGLRANLLSALAGKARLSPRLAYQFITSHHVKRVVGAAWLARTGHLRVLLLLLLLMLGRHRLRTSWFLRYLREEGAQAIWLGRRLRNAHHWRVLRGLRLLGHLAHLLLRECALAHEHLLLLGWHGGLACGLACRLSIGLLHHKSLHHLHHAIHLLLHLRQLHAVLGRLGLPSHGHLLHLLLKLHHLLLHEGQLLRVLSLGLGLLRLLRGHLLRRWLRRLHGLGRRSRHRLRNVIGKRIVHRVHRRVLEARLVGHERVCLRLRWSNWLHGSSRCIEDGVEGVRRLGWLLRRGLLRRGGLGYRLLRRSGRKRAPICAPVVNWSRLRRRRWLCGRGTRKIQQGFNVLGLWDGRLGWLRNRLLCSLDLLHWSCLGWSYGLGHGLGRRCRLRGARRGTKAALTRGLRFGLKNGLVSLVTIVLLAVLLATRSLRRLLIARTIEGGPFGGLGRLLLRLALLASAALLLRVLARVVVVLLFCEALLRVLLAEELLHFVGVGLVGDGVLRGLPVLHQACLLVLKESAIDGSLPSCRRWSGPAAPALRRRTSRCP